MTDNGSVVNKGKGKISDFQNFNCITLSLPTEIAKASLGMRRLNLGQKLHLSLMVL